MGLEEELKSSVFQLQLFCFEVIQNRTQTNLRGEKGVIALAWLCRKSFPQSYEIGSDWPNLGHVPIWEPIRKPGTVTHLVVLGPSDSALLQYWEKSQLHPEWGWGWFFRGKSGYGHYRRRNECWILKSSKSALLSALDIPSLFGMSRWRTLRKWFEIWNWSLCAIELDMQFNPGCANKRAPSFFWLLKLEKIEGKKDNYFCETHFIMWLHCVPSLSFLVGLWEVWKVRNVF